MFVSTKLSNGICAWPLVSGKWRVSTRTLLAHKEIFPSAVVPRKEQPMLPEVAGDGAVGLDVHVV
jgi:hypothetical protein